MTTRPPREEEIWRPDAGAYIPAWSRSFLKTYGVWVQWAKGLPPLEDSLAYLWLAEDAVPHLIWLRRHHSVLPTKGEELSTGQDGYQIDGVDKDFDSFRELIDYLKIALPTPPV